MKLSTTDIIFLVTILIMVVDEVFLAAGYCYQCNSRNSACGMQVNETLKLDGTPCNGQCYTRLNQDDNGVIYRGCSWEHGFMTLQPADMLIVERHSVWVFCDTSYCNVEATSLLNSICWQPICSLLTFPQDCELTNVDITCGIECGNELC